MARGGWTGSAGVDPSDASIVFECFSGISSAESPVEGFGHLSRAVEALGFGAISYTVVPLSLAAAGKVDPVFLVSPSFSADFLDHYGQAGLARHDFTIERASAGSVRTLDWQQELRRGELTAEQRGVIDLARADYGIRNAMTLPTRSDRHVIAGASVVCEEWDKPFETLRRERAGTLGHLVRFFHDWAFATPDFRRHFYANFLGQLSDDEVKVIRLAINGQLLKNSRELYGLSPSRAGNLLSGLYRRLDVKNASELSYLVGLHQIGQLL